MPENASSAVKNHAAGSLTGSIGGRFQIGERLGKGAMGEVYRAHDTRLKRTVALKRLSPYLRSDPLYRKRFEQEAERASAFSDSHAAAIYDVIEYRGWAVPARGAGLANVLDRTHSRGFIRRSLSPFLADGFTRHPAASAGLFRPKLPAAGDAIRKSRLTTSSAVRDVANDCGDRLGSQGFGCPGVLGVAGQELGHVSIRHLFGLV
jgi:hypothetical protein